MRFVLLYTHILQVVFFQILLKPFAATFNFKVKKKNPHSISFVKIASFCLRNTVFVSSKQTFNVKKHPA